MGIKVVQWATGVVGSRCLQEIIRHPDLELVGLLVHSKAKEGLDAGEIAGLGTTGIAATRDVDEIVALDADVVIHNPKMDPDLDALDRDVIRLLESGKNVISTLSYVHPATFGAEYERRLDAACRRGNSSLLGTGLNPGFLLDRLAMTITGLSMRVDSIEAFENFNVYEDPSPDMICDVLGIGHPAESFDSQGPIAQGMAYLYSQSIRAVEQRLGVRFDRVETDHSVALAEQDETIPATVVRKGTVAGICWKWINYVDGKPFLTLTMRFAGVRHLGGEWQFDDHWTVKVNGQPGLSLDFRVAPGDSETALTAGAQAVAALVMRAIPEVLAAPAGIIAPTVFAHYNTRYVPQVGRLD